jgi:hypothetical protein
VGRNIRTGLGETEKRARDVEPIGDALQEVNRAHFPAGQNLGDLGLLLSGKATDHALREASVLQRPKQPGDVTCRQWFRNFMPIPEAGRHTGLSALRDVGRLHGTGGG